MMDNDLSYRVGDLVTLCSVGPKITNPKLDITCKISYVNANGTYHVITMNSNMVGWYRDVDADRLKPFSMPDLPCYADHSTIRPCTDKCDYRRGEYSPCYDGCHYGGWHGKSYRDTGE